MTIRLPESIIPLYLRATHASEPFKTVAGAHRRIRERYLRPVPFAPPEGLDGVLVDRRPPAAPGWPVYDLKPVTTGRTGGSSSVVLYVHGGGWVHEIAAQHWQLIARLVRETGQRVVVPIYPLVPLGTARAVHDGVLSLLKAELAAGHEVRLAGDSSGGQIALAAALTLRDQGVVLPATTLLSPALDLTWQNPGIDAVAPHDPWLGRPGGAVLAEAWRGADDIEDPVVSPLFGELEGLGPLTILSGTRDVLNPDARLLRDRARRSGVPVTWHEAEGQLHVYALLPTRQGERGAAQLVESLRPRGQERDQRS